MGELAQLVDGLDELRHRGVETVVDRARVHAVLEVPQVEPDRHQSLLGPVVQVALETAAFLDGRRHQPGA